MRNFLASLAAGLMLLGAATSSRADPILDFGVSTQSSGSPLISYAGASSSLVGTNIVVDHVTGSQTPLQNGNTLVFSPSASLNFATGALTSFTSSGLSTWTFGPGGSISITGSSFSGTLLSGMFNTATTVIDTGNGFKFAGAGIFTVVDSGLAAFYGLPQGTSYQGGMTLLFPSTTASDSSFSTNQISSGDIGVSSVPEPGSMALGCFGGLGLLLSGYAGRRFKKPVLV